MKSLDELLKEYKKYQELHLNLNMSRGKPSKEQLDLSLSMMDTLSSKSNYIAEGNIDTRNYGELTGIKELKNIFSELMGVENDNIIIYGNSSLNIMYNLISKSFTHGVMGNAPFYKQGKIKWLCPAPGYDRHFKITEYFNFELIPIRMTSNGIDMDAVEEYIKDESVKGIWCVPKYSNPGGVVYSDEVIRRLARLKPKAKDFRIYYDNAYTIHYLYEGIEDHLLNIFIEAKKYDNEDLIYEFMSTSKISFPGSGVSAISASINNINDIKKHMGVTTIGYDKINMLRHSLYFKDANGLKNKAMEHAQILRPKFELVDKIFNEEIKDIATWTKPNGGYFIELKVDGCAKEVVKRAKEAGVVLTDAGAMFPYGIDPTNSYLRIAPSYPDIKELELATRILVLSVKIETQIKRINELKAINL